MACSSGSDHEAAPVPGFHWPRCNAVQWAAPVLVPSSESPQGNLRSCEMPPRPEPKLPVTLPHTLQTQMGQVATCSVQKPLAYGESLVMRIAWTSVFASHLLSCPSCS